MKTLESPLDGKEIQPVHPTGNQSWIITGRTDAEAETPILWPPDAKNWLIRKDPDTGNDWRQEEKGTTEDEMVGWHHRLKGHESEWKPGVGDGTGGLACCSSWGHKESDITERLNSTEPDAQGGSPPRCMILDFCIWCYSSHKVTWSMNECLIAVEAGHDEDYLVQPRSWHHSWCLHFHFY